MAAEPDRAPRWALRALDGVQYGVALTATVAVVAAVLAYGLALATRGVDALGRVDALLAAKWLLFFGGFAAMAFGALKLRPRPPYRENSRFALTLSNESREGGFADQVTSLPPLAWFEPRNVDRLSGGGRLLVASGLMLLTSILLEVALGVSV